VNKLSGGQQRRLDVAIALAGDPELLFLDEPTTGFDPSARRNAWEVVKNLIAIGKTVFLTTHFMDEAQYLADPRDRDRERPDRRGRTSGESRRPRPDADEDPLPTPRDRAAPRGPVRRLADGSLEIDVDAADTTKAVHDLTGWALDRGLVLESLEITQPSLEDVYLQLTGAEVGT
jgi:ABC-2 type transport system ATP-binding protein